MDDRRLYETILGLEAPWYVEGVEVRAEEEEILVRLERAERTPLLCPEGGQSAPGYDRSPERRPRARPGGACGGSQPPPFGRALLFQTLLHR
ncbi:MAG: hypothetical protein ACE5JR_05635 [Gemmatimonadota bacterium]